MRAPVFLFLFAVPALASVTPTSRTSSLTAASLSGLSDPDLISIYAEVSGLTTDANLNAIPHPTDTTTYTVTSGSTTIEVPANMVYIPAGSFTYGSGSSAATQTLEAYCIGKYEVTNAEWKAYLDANNLTSYPSHWTNGTYPAGKSNHPVLYVSLNSALAYCAWVSSRTGWSITVPTAPQWEKAARGPNAYLYPWGNATDTSYNSSTGALATKFNYNAVTASYFLFNQPNLTVTYTNRASPYYGQTATVSTITAYDSTGSATRLSVSASGNVSGWVNHDTYTGFIYTSLYDSLMETGGNTTAVGSYPNGQSAYGCYDMAGNVFEWTTTVSTATNGAESGQSVNEVRGGSWYATGTSGRSISIGEGRSASGAFNTVGFRIVRNLTTTASSGSTATTSGTSTSTSTTTSTSTSTTGTSTATNSGGGGAPSGVFFAAFSVLLVRRLRALRLR